MSRPMVVAFQAVESPSSRMFREVAGGIVTDEQRRKPPGLGTFWCAADKPRGDDHLVLAPVYRTTPVPKDALCEECRCEIAALQEMFTQIVRRWASRERT